MKDKVHHKAMKLNALTCIYLMPTNCIYNSHNDCTIPRCLISHIFRSLASILKKKNYHNEINFLWAQLLVSGQSC
jgi:hypothetical protein